MNRTSLTLAFGLAVALVGGAAAPARAAKYKIRWVLGHQNLDYFEEAAQSFKKAVEAGSRKDISVEIVTGMEGHALLPHGENGPEIAEAVAAGSVEMGHSFTDVVGAIDPRFWAFNAPYLFQDYRHLEGVLEGAPGQEMLAGLRDKRIVGLSFTFSGGASGIATTGRELRSPEDLKGLKVGVYGDKVSEAWLKSLGATPVLVGHNVHGVLPMAREGALDAVVTTWRNFERPGLHQGFKNMSLVGSTYLVSVTYINEKFFEGLPEKHRALIKAASLEAGRIERAKTIELNEYARRQMLAKGVGELVTTGERTQAFLRALEPAYSGSIEGLIGKDFLERIRKTPGEDQPSIPGGLASRWSAGR